MTAFPGALAHRKIAAMRSAKKIMPVAVKTTRNLCFISSTSSTRVGSVACDDDDGAS